MNANVSLVIARDWVSLSFERIQLGSGNRVEATLCVVPLSHTHLVQTGQAPLKTAKISFGPLIHHKTPKVSGRHRRERVTRNGIQESALLCRVGGLTSHLLVLEELEDILMDYQFGQIHASPFYQDHLLRGDIDEFCTYDPSITM